METKRWLMSLAIAFMGTHLFQNIAAADRRSYVWTYEYLTIPAGEGEIEYYYTQQTGSLNNFTDTTILKHWVEIEHGITDHWDIALYQTFAQKPESSLIYEGFKIRTRYRFSESGILPVNPLLYFEYIRNFPEKEDEFEGKLILGKNIKRFNISANIVGEFKIEDGKVETEPEAILAVSFEPGPNFKLGTEYEISEKKAYLGPTVSFASGERWTTMGVRWGLTENSRDLDFRLLIGIGL
ncbi:MAG TPA: hypothetical protein VII00_08050 [bacterium]